MSDFILTIGSKLDPNQLSSLVEVSPSTTTEVDQGELFALAKTHFGSESDWGSAVVPDRGLKASVVGRIALDASEWSTSAATALVGGLAAGHLLSKWMGGGARSVQQFNGAATVLIVDRRAGVLHLWTDRLGGMPVYARESSDGLVLGSFADAVAAASSKLGHRCSLDSLTLAEFIRTGRATQPFTYWKEVKQLEAGAYYTVTLAPEPRIELKSRYWRPGYFDGDYLRGRDRAVEALEEGLRRAVGIRTQERLGASALLLSAGADSRSILFGACDPSSVQCFTLYDELNPEVEGAKQLASAASAPLELLQRTSTYYLDHAAETVRLTGGMWSLESGHWTGVIDSLMRSEPGVVLSGCFADYLYKGIAYGRRPKRLLGRHLPVYQLEHVAPDAAYYHPWVGIASGWERSVSDRIHQHSESLPPAPIQSRAEFARVSPISRETDVAGRTLLRRLTPFDPPMLDRGLLDLFGSLDPRQKLNGVAFGMAVERICGGSTSKVLNNNFSASVGASERKRVAMFLMGVIRRKLSRPTTSNSLTTQGVATPGSWPNMGKVIAGSPVFDGWAGMLRTEHRELLEGIVGVDVLARDRAQMAQYPFTSLRLHTAALWLEQQSPFIEPPSYP